MDTKDVQVGSTITNGSSALRVTERVEKDPRWKAPGWRGLCISLEEFGGNTGMTDFIPDYLLASWRHVPFEWLPVVGGELEERYVWSSDWRYLRREVRRTVKLDPADSLHDLADTLEEARVPSDVGKCPTCGMQSRSYSSGCNNCGHGRDVRHRAGLPDRRGRADRRLASRAVPGGRPMRWWELPSPQQREGRQGRLALVAGRMVGIDCPVCGAAPVVYNGNYFCDNWVFPGPPGEGECVWALPHPATRKRDREVCDLIGIDYE